MVKCWSSAPQFRPTAREVVMVVDMLFSVDYLDTDSVDTPSEGSGKAVFFFFIVR